MSFSILGVIICICIAFLGKGTAAMAAAGAGVGSTYRIGNCLQIPAPALAHISPDILLYFSQHLPTFLPTPDTRRPLLFSYSEGASPAFLYGVTTDTMTHAVTAFNTLLVPGVYASKFEETSAEELCRPIVISKFATAMLEAKTPQKMPYKNSTIIVYIRALLQAMMQKFSRDLAGVPTQHFAFFDSSDTWMPGLLKNVQKAKFKQSLQSGEPMMDKVRYMCTQFRPLSTPYCERQCTPRSTHS